MNKDLYKIMRLEQIQEEEGDFFCEAEADLIIEKEIKEFEEWINVERLFKVELYAQAYYSGAEYLETLFTNNPEILDYDGLIVSVGELDGKHSDVMGKMYVEEVTGQALSEPESNDGNSLYYELTDKLEMEIVKPFFEKRKHTIYCTDAQWDKIQLILGGANE